MLRPILFFLAATWTFQIVSAHFELTYPPTRGFDEARESIFPCGGFNVVEQNRTLVPLNNSFVQIDSDHTSYTYIVNVLRNNNPRVPDFTGSDLYTVAYGDQNHPEASCIPFNVSNSTEFANGTNATIQVVFNGGDGVLYQCTDVMFVDSAPDFERNRCATNADGSPVSVSGSDSIENNASLMTTFSCGLLVLAIACTYAIV